jgi:2-hydroxycyclohexanecarboxyl-CoA dehydrogenase
MGRLDGKIAAVTGGASGIGEATVRRFLAEGASVAFCDRDGERGQRVAAELETACAKVTFTQADVGTEAACLAFVNGAAQKFARLDILINNAGIRKYEKVDEEITIMANRTTNQLRSRWRVPMNAIASSAGAITGNTYIDMRSAK